MNRVELESGLQWRPSPRRAATEGGPFPTHQLAVPAQDHLWPDEQRARPGESWTASKQSRDRHPIGWPPARLGYVTLQDAQLLPKQEEFDLRIAWGQSEQQNLRAQSEAGVDKRGEHGP